MKSGYVVKMEAFVPCDPMDPESMRRALDEVSHLKQIADDVNTVVTTISTKFVRKRGGNGDEPIAA